MPNSIRLDRNVPMEMRDGTILRADICRPDDNGKYPVVLTRTGYGKIARMERREAAFLNIIGSTFSGFARVFQDIRGRFASEGGWTESEEDRNAQEVTDGFDTVEWIASQPWCDGNVGMIGTSWDAQLQWLTASGNPPHLKAIAPDVGTCGPMTEQTIMGSPAQLSYLVFWTLATGINILDKLEQQGKDVSRARQLLLQGIANPDEVYNFRPLKDIPHFQFEGLRDSWKRVAEGFFYPPKTDPGDKLFWPYHKVKIACLHTGGWYDAAPWSQFKNFMGMREQGGSQFARDHQHILMGPWKHGAQTNDYLAELSFGIESSVPMVLLSQSTSGTNPHIDFFNKYLRGMDVKVPAVRYFLMGKNEWKTTDTWHLPGTQWQRFFLHSKGRANTSAGDGLLSRDEPGTETPDIFLYNPDFPVPTIGGRFMANGGLIPGPRDQQFIERRSDILCYSTSKLNEDVEVTGALELHLFAATSARDTDFTVKLVDVYPDGRGYNVADGLLRARLRKSFFKEELVTPGEVNEYTINMGVTSCLFKKGHRIRIDVSSSNFPAFDRNMNTGNPMGGDAEGKPAVQTVFHQSGIASYIDLPVIMPHK